LKNTRAQGVRSVVTAQYYDRFLAVAGCSAADGCFSTAPHTCFRLKRKVDVTLFVVFKI
jgi:hypothetical protein